MLMGSTAQERTGEPAKENSKSDEKSRKCGLGKRAKKLRRLNIKRKDWKKEHGGNHCVKGCCKERRNRLFSACLVNSTKRDKIKSQQVKFELITKGNFLTVLPSGGYCLRVLYRWRRWLRTAEADVHQKWCRCSGSCCGQGMDLETSLSHLLAHDYMNGQRKCKSQGTEYPDDTKFLRFIVYNVFSWFWKHASCLF